MRTIQIILNDGTMQLSKDIISNIPKLTNKSENATIKLDISYNVFLEIINKIIHPGKFLPDSHKREMLMLGLTDDTDQHIIVNALGTVFLVKKKILKQFSFFETLLLRWNSAQRYLRKYSSIWILLLSNIYYTMLNIQLILYQKDSRKN